MDIFQNIGALTPSRTKFDLSYKMRYTCDMGMLIPTFWQEAVPGDVFYIGQEHLIRLQPLVAPVLDNMYVVTEYFFVPTRLIDENWTSFITGIKEGSVPPEEYTGQPPTWNPTNNAKYSLWDYFGLPVGVVPTGSLPLDYLRRGYNLIYNEWYRDENLQDLVDLSNENVLYRSWRKDYFGSALPFRQKGIAPSIPLTGTGFADFSNTDKFNALNRLVFTLSSSDIAGTNNPSGLYVNNTTGEVKTTADAGFVPLYGVIANESARNSPLAMYTTGGSASNFVMPLVGNQQAIDTDNLHWRNFTQWLNQNSFNFENAGTFDVSDLRDMFQLQKWMERNARGGTRYVEFLKAHFGVSPSDARLQLPEYLGSVRSNVIISEVLQTSASDTTSAQGNLAGKGSGIAKAFVDKYEVEEYGWLFGLTTIYPRPSYSQGINKMLLRYSRLEQFYPEFVNLSEQGIKNVEIYASDNSEQNNGIWGYTGIYNEMRIRNDIVCGDLRDTLGYWVMTRVFNGLPSLNSQFLECRPSKDIFAVQDEHGIIATVYNDIQAIRPLPVISEPGLIDHH